MIGSAEPQRGDFASPHFEPLELAGARRHRHRDLPASLPLPDRYRDRHGLQVIRGIPFDFGEAEGPDVIFLDADPVTIELADRKASYVVFVHVAENVVTNYKDGFADRAGMPGMQLDGYEIGGQVSEYELEYDDGSTHGVPVLRRFAIQQSRTGWGSVPAACVAAAENAVLPTAREMLMLGRTVSGHALPVAEHGLETRGASAANDTGRGPNDGLLWIYALANPFPEKPLRRLTCAPRGERSAIYAISTTELAEHPLRLEQRRKLRLPLPAGIELNAIGAVDDVEIDLGTVISARAALDYDHERWAGAAPLAEPSRSEREVLIEYTAHPKARLRLGKDVHALASLAGDGLEVKPAHRPVSLRFLDDHGNPAAVRLHLHGERGEYLAPRGHHRKVQAGWSDHIHPELVDVENQYAYIDGECVAELPLGTVYVDVCRGYEIAPLRTSVEVGPETDELVFELERVLRWRERGWVTADTHVHFLSPQTALLEGKAEGVNVVNLLASQWGEMFSNVGDFDGRTTLGAEDLGGEGEFLVRVGSENRMHVLGHISLVGYSGKLIEPLCTGGLDESALGDPVEATMAEWAQRCIDQGGLVVMPHAPMPQLERAADIVLGLVQAIEMMAFNPRNPEMGQLSAYGLADWYRYLNLGYHVPVVGGSDKMSTSMLLGGLRTYAQLGERELTYQGWMDAIRAGNTFATVGPLAALRVEGVEPGGRIELPAGGGTVQVEWEVESVCLPIEKVEVIVGGLVAEEVDASGTLTVHGHAAVTVPKSSWIALRVRGSYHGRPEDVAAHTSAVQVLVEGSELFSETDSMTVLEQIQGAIAYVDTLATRPEERRFKALRATLETAYNRLHQRMHAAGVYHRHPLHDPSQPHEH